MEKNQRVLKNRIKLTILGKKAGRYWESCGTMERVSNDDISQGSPGGSDSTNQAEKSAPGLISPSQVTRTLLPS